MNTPILLFGTADTCPEIEYATGFRAVDSVLFLKKANKQYMLVPEFEFGRASAALNTRKHNIQTEILTLQILGISHAKSRSMGQRALKLLKKASVRKVTIPPSFPYGLAKSLEKAGIHIVIAKKELFPERAIKTTEEIRLIKESQQAAVIAMRTAIAAISSSEISAGGFLKKRGRSLTSEDIKQIISKTLVDHNCFCKETIVACGKQAADPHARGEGPLLAGESIVIDIFPKHMEHGYWGDLTRTVVRGKPSRRLKKMYSAVKSAQNAAMNHVRAGVKCATIHSVAVHDLEKRGFVSATINDQAVGFIHNTGHGVGLAIHEAPSLAMNDNRLKSGNIITIEPGLYYPDIGGIRIEDTIVVDPKGWRYLAPCEKKFEL